MDFIRVEIRIVPVNGCLVHIYALGIGVVEVPLVESRRRGICIVLIFPCPGCAQTTGTYCVNPGLLITL